MEARSVLLVGSDPSLEPALRESLAAHGIGLVAAGTREEVDAALAAPEVAVAVVDIAFAEAGGPELVRQVKRRRPSVDVVLLSPKESVERTLAAMRAGTYDHCPVPSDDPDDLVTRIRRMLDKSQLEEKNRAILRVLTEQNRELAESVRRLTSLIDASRAMGEFESPERLLELFTELVATELGVERLSLMLVDRDAGELHIAAHRGLHDVDVERVRVPLGHGIAGRVAATAEPILVEDARIDPRMPHTAQPDLSNSFMSVPLVLSVPIMSHAKVLGVLNVANRTSGLPFTADDLDYVRGMATQIAVSIESARRFEDLQAAYDSLRAAQDQLVASERLQAVGQMAAGVAHDFNNALAVILGRTETCLLRLDSPGELDLEGLRMDLEAITKTSMQAADTIRRVQEFTRIRRDTPHGRVDMNRVVREAVEMTRPKWRGEAGSHGREVEVRVELAEAPFVRGNPHEITQVLNNLIFNAVEAMPEGGCITLRTAVDGDRVVTEVSDNGTGMDEEARSRVFEPFFTTKPTGNGLGMSIVYGIVERHGGRIDVDSVPGEGTRFRLELPVATGPELAEPEAAPASGGATHASILLVDDDEIVRQTIQQALEAHGHRVVAAASGSQAERAFAPDRFDVVITDFNMPGMSGAELARGLRDRGSDVPVILLSGWTMQEDEAAMREAGVGFALPKPCPADVLLRTISAAVASRGTAD